ncbi:MAG: branched-chain amino acid ABC transporter permease [Tissierellia bacterium]|nr:branched-chain amino acid ABC transporter permease [Tissierellia bacterium]
MSNLAQNLANGISLGSLYALIAIGYTLVYGILRLINFAHGDLFMIGAYVMLYGLTLTNLPWVIVVIGGAFLLGGLGVILEKLAYSPLRSSARITVLISAIGASFLLQNLGLLIFGGRPKAFPIPVFLDRVVRIGGVSINLVSIFIPIITIALVFILQYLVNHTKTGMAMRAMSRDFEAVSLMGIDVNRVVSFTFFIGSFLAAVGGFMWSVKYPSLLPVMGTLPGMKCFIAAVIGGIGNIYGAVLGGLMLGLLEIMIIGIFPTLTGYRDAFAFILLIVILLFKPTGLFGKRIAEKV